MQQQGETLRLPFWGGKNNFRCTSGYNHWQKQQYICKTSAQRFRRWSNIVQMLHKCLVLVWY